MNHRNATLLCAIVCLLWCGPAATVRAEETSVAAWPELTQTVLPWTRWWWHGSAVDNENLTRCLEQYAAAGLGGVEITCIYGVQGTRDRQLEYLSHPWVEAVTFAVQEAQRLGLGVDLPPGSGWRMGGPRVPVADGNAELRLTHEQPGAGTLWLKDFGDKRPEAVVAYSAKGEARNLTGQIDTSGALSWAVPQVDGPWTVYLLQQHLTGEKVKRPAPGGAGLNINPFSKDSVTHFLADFAGRTAAFPPGAIRASFHDSFEYEGNWSGSFLREFERRRGYRMQDHLPELDGVGDPDTVARVKCDYRETMSDLVLDELIKPWVAWAHARGELARNQSHGSPANWLDLYAACDIPETESFGSLHKLDANPLVQKFASSAAHVAGHPLVSSESATWLGEHFCVTLAMVKERLDRQMLAGINHAFYHGTAYSPANAAWPGWLFYASTQLNPQNPIWRDFPALNHYVARCQSLLQSGEPDNDLLIYWPIYDVWSDPRGLRQELRVHDARTWFFGQPIGKVAEQLDQQGISFDYISDRQIAECSLVDGQIESPGARYRAILVPDARYIPSATLQKLAALAAAGGKVLFLDSLPQSPPGLLTPAKEQDFEKTLQAAKKSATVGDDLLQLLEGAGVTAEPFRASTPLQEIRRRFDDGVFYFLKNPSSQPFDGWIEVNPSWQSAVLMEPLTGAIGIAASDAHHKVRVQLAGGETVFLQLYDHKVSASNWQYRDVQGEPSTLPSPWKVTFLVGGPELPASTSVDKLQSWTEFAGKPGEVFAGTARYETALPLPAEGPGKYLLTLGEVADSARVLLNGEEVGVLLAAPHEIVLDLEQPKNTLAIEVTNVAANRIRDLDRHGVVWRIFDDINFVNVDYKPFDASQWPIRPAGLLGPVTLQRLTFQQTSK